MRSLLPTLLLLGGAGLFMVHAMVKWTEAALARGARAAAPLRPGLSPQARWGTAYLAAWVALIGLFLVFFERLGTPDLDEKLLLLVLAAGGWLGLNWGFLALARRMASRDEPAAAFAEEEIQAGEEAPVPETPPETRVRS